MPIITGNWETGTGEIRLRVSNQLTNKVIVSETTIGTYAYLWATSAGAWRYGTSAPTSSTYDSAGSALTGASGASLALDNIASCAINTSLISDTHNTDDLGTEPIGWRTGYFGTSVIFVGTTYNTTVAFTEGAASRTYTIPDAGAAHIPSPMLELLLNSC